VGDKNYKKTIFFTVRTRIRLKRIENIEGKMDKSGIMDYEVGIREESGQLIKKTVSKDERAWFFSF